MKMLLIFVLLVMAAYGETTVCTCPEAKINHISPLTFGMTLLSPTFTSLYFNTTAENNEVLIKHPSEPIWFADIEYFWDNEYYQGGGQRHSKVCSYHIFHYHKELRKIKYNTTHRPSTITFGCHWYQECCDLGCCTHGFLNVFILVLLYGGLGVMLVSFCSQLPTESEEDRRMRARAEIAILFPCPEDNGQEEIPLQEMPEPPKYDDLYPNGCTYNLVTPEIVLHPADEDEATVEA
ncbi:hypothetical protein GCK72_016776 [Caenorhabditis remanei]|uniref:CX domain-containing protein n=1 Tax=Caenorhabditis remanei TaxID=31234 RepID=A0A6A5G6X1_CAERE|nr:hypothetical protein GCK72_016776 [Caenorhabditis remanei]KAF1750229.1 hypothetical protein GCK72_016776 [Caenorhabditis remanei]